MKHKILESFGIKEYPWNTWKNRHILLKSRLKWFWQRHTIGFDSRECYDLDNTLLLLLLERLVQFKKDSNKIIDWSGSQHITYKEVEYTMPDFIDAMIDKITFVLHLDKYANRADDLHIDMIALDEEDNQAFCEVLDMLKLCYQSLWW